MPHNQHVITIQMEKRIRMMRIIIRIIKIIRIIIKIIRITRIIYAYISDIHI